MNTYLVFNVKKKVTKLLLVFLLFSQVFVSCNKDEIKTDPYFNIEGDPTGISVDRTSNESQNYVVRSNRSWQIVPQGEDRWAKTFPTEGKDDGIFKFIIEENNTFDARTMNFAFIVDGEEQPVLFRIDQEANIPYITILGADNGITVASAGGVTSININANVPWTYSLDDNSWLTEEGLSDTQLQLLAAKNRGDERSAILTISSAQYPSLDQDVVITQSSGSVILQENFSWLAYGSTVPYEWENAVRYDSWTQEERDRGWTVTPNEFSKDEPLCYAMIGYVKLGKTNYGGDLISPNLDIEGTVNLLVTFKSATYIAATGNVDDRILKVYALGAGTTSVSEFSIDNIPNSKAEDEAGIINDIWDPARAYSFTITGATSQTRIKFLGGDYDLRTIGQGKNRIFLDDIRVEIVE
ncbi:MAG: hypothetical protein K9H49_03910 [Bacteroidales bacterium]|nr:hypothetical protein [Bacteroidales bacterium]MCF8391689.1 hypothetical protein [Bacteroidales bacterium]